MKTIKTNKLIDMDVIVSKLRKAGEIYRTTRGRGGIYELLDAAYGVYCRIRKGEKLGRRKLLLRKTAELPASRSRPLSDLVLTIASKDQDRRDRHRWKRLIEAAYRRKVEPRDFKRQLHNLHGINSALAFWTIGPPPIMSPGQSPFPGSEFDQSSRDDIPFAVDGE